MRKIIVKRLGVVDYMTAWSLMKDFVTAASPDKKDEIWICEHPKVFTLGAKGNLEHVICPGDIPVIKTDRGGDVTYHGPGQVVIYPIINISRLNLYPKRFLWKIEEAVINFLSDLSVDAFRIPKAPGIYVQGQTRTGPFAGACKICSIGIKISKGTTYHGLALNFKADLDDFKKINPCGYRGLEMVNLADLVPSVSKESATNLLIDRLLEQLT